MANPKIILDGDSTGAVSAVSRLKTEFNALQSMAAKAMSFGGALAGSAVVANLVATTKAVIDTGDALNKMSQKTGIAVEDLSKLQYAADLSGVSTEALQKGLTAMAVGMAEAATGAGPMAEEYKKLGINVRNVDGTMKSSRVVLGELADKFQLMPDGVDKANLAVSIFGKKLGADMIPMLNMGSAGLKAMGDEAEKLGLVMSSELAKKSEEFNDNLDRLGKLSQSVGMDIANALIPGLNDLAKQYILAKRAGLGFVDFMMMSNDEYENAAKELDVVTQKLSVLKKQQEDLSKPTLANKINNAIDPSDLAITDAQIKKLEQKKKYLEEISKQQKAEDDASEANQILKANKRIALESQLQAKLAELAKLRSIAEGQVSAEILLTDEKRIAAQIKNAQTLRDALSAAWKQSIEDAKAAGEAAKNAFAKAADIRQTANDKATDKERSAMSPEDQQALIQKDFRNAADAADSAATLAQFAYQHKRTENGARLAAQAAKDADRAAKFADQISDPNASAKAIREAGEIAAKLQEAQGNAKLKEQKDLEERATSQNELITNLDKQITELQTKAAAIQVKADISAAEGAITTLQTQLAALQDKTVTVTVNTVAAGAANPGSVNKVGSSDAPLPGLATGGYTGPGGKWQPAGIVHAGEFVHRQEVVRQPGALAFLARFNQIGMAALRRNGYAAGGLVNNLVIPSLSSRAVAQGASGPNATFNFPGFGSFQASVTPDVMGDLKNAFAREALKKGGRR